MISAKEGRLTSTKINQRNLMKRKYLLAISAFALFGILSLFLVRLSQKPSVRILPLEDDSWRKKVQYEKVTKLSELQRRDIYQQVIQQMSISSTPDTAYYIIASKNGIALEDVKNIIGEGIAFNWKTAEDSSSENQNK